MPVSDPLRSPQALPHNTFAQGSMPLRLIRWVHPGLRIDNVAVLRQASRSWRPTERPPRLMTDMSDSL
jgi:hypothetical protein